MVNELLVRDQYPNGVTRGRIILLVKEGDRLNLTNWQPIMNLNTTYKIFAKALQQQLQRLLLEEINNDQTIFLPL